MIILLASCSYLPEETDGNTYLKQDLGDYAVYYSSDELPGKAFYMVPGGLVDPFVYECWIENLVTNDSSIAVVLLKYPSNLAVLNIGKVMKIKGQLTDIQHWVIGGHSLGGTVAATVVNQYRDAFEGMVLMGSWSREATDLSDWQGSVLSMYASEDLLVSEEEVIDNSAYLPEGEELGAPVGWNVAPATTYYFRIEGGNHSGFGCYGPQAGDGESSITEEQQLALVISALQTFIRGVW